MLFKFCNFSFVLSIASDKWSSFVDFAFYFGGHSLLIWEEIHVRIGLFVDGVLFKLFSTFFWLSLDSNLFDSVKRLLFDNG